VEIQVKNLSKRLAEKHITIELTDEARDLLAKRGFDPVYGARPLKRVIQRLILDPMAMEIIAGTIGEDSIVTISTGEDGLQFKPRQAQAA
jgi:ATP-dependent Clp protease ATP-binding subunit ClpB